MRDRDARRAPGAAIAELTPGTTSNGMPAARSASASSPPRPNTNGSPPFRRTTRLPRRAARIMSAVDRLLAHRGPAGALADREALRARRELERLRRDERVVEDEVGLAPARARRARSAARDRRGRRRRARRSRSCAGRRLGVEPVQRLEQQRPPLARTARRSPSAGARSAAASSTQVVELVGQHGLERLAQQARERGRAALGRDRDRDAAAADDAADVGGGATRRRPRRSRRRAAPRRRAATARFTSGVAAATTSHAPSRSAGSKAAALDASRAAACDLGIDLRRHDRDLAPAASRPASFDAATAPAADHAARCRPASFRKTGKSETRSRRRARAGSARRAARAPRAPRGCGQGSPRPSPGRCCDHDLGGGPAARRDRRRR